MKPAREPASSRPKPCASLKNALRILPVRRFLLTLVGRKKTEVSTALALTTWGASSWLASQFMPLILAHRGSALPWLVDDRDVLPPSPNLVRTYPMERNQALRDSASCFSRAVASRRTHQIGARKRRASGEHHPQPTKPPPHLNRPAESRVSPVLHPPERPSTTPIPQKHY